VVRPGSQKLLTGVEITQKARPFPLLFTKKQGNPTNMNIRKIKHLSLALVAAALTISGIATATAATLTVGNVSSLPCTGTFPTIQSAVIAASPGDTISVCPGTYNELVQVDKTLTFLGAQNGVDARTRAVPASSESTVGSGDGAFQILADNVVIDGFTIQGVVNDPSQPPFTGLGAGIWSNPGFSGTNGGFKIRNNIIQNNIIGIEMDNTGVLPARVERNLIQNNNNPGPDGGVGIDTSTSGANNVVVDSNKFLLQTMNAAVNNFVGGSNLTFSNNEFDSNFRAFALFKVVSSSITGNNIHNSTEPTTADIRFFGGVSGLSITCNRLANGAGRGLRFNDAGFGGGPNSMITINFNNISGYPVAGLEVDTAGYSGGPGSLDATNDWWGSSTGPTIASNPGGTGEPIIDPDGVVTYKPFLTNPSNCAPPPPPTPTSFVIGDRSAVVGRKVTFWGAQWAKSNSLSGGAAPSSFKGYANAPSSNPPACGGTWKSDPGNSSQPPDSVASFIKVIVSSSITKSGSTISGNIPETAVIKTDPGYAPNPGHAGTGTVVSVGCP
jgi:hypothetical protein